METIGYCRVSTDDQSIANQQMQIEEAGYNIAKWFTDEAVSGSVKASSRDGFSRLLAYAREGVNRPGFPGECFICELRLP
ncbi:recombinase family protein, partial [Escherichia coli]|nr:recombinase family protein [Escherichia coli]